MSKLELDAEMRSKLDGINDHVELCDETGKTVGHFLPTALYERMYYAALALESPHSPEELKRRRNETGGRSLKEIWLSLGRTS